MNLLDFISHNSDQSRQQGEEDKRQAALAKSADYFMSAFGDNGYAKVGVSKEGWNNLSATDRVGAVHGLIQAQTMQKMMKELEREQADQTYQDQQRVAQGKFQQRLGPMQPGEQGPPQSMTPDRIMGAASDTGYNLDPREILQMMKENHATNWQDVMPREFEVGGAKGAVGKSGQFQFLPQTTPDSLQAIPVTDPEGNIIGMRVPTAKGGSAPLPAAKAPKELPASFFDPYHKLVDTFQTATASAAKPDDYLKSLTTPGTPADKRKRYQDAAKQTQDNLRKHFELYRSQGYGTPEVWQQLYQDNGITPPAAGGKAAASDRVTVTKGGKQFTLPASQLAEAEQQGYKRVGK